MWIWGKFFAKYYFWTVGSSNSSRKGGIFVLALAVANEQEAAKGDKEMIGAFSCFSIQPLLAWEI